MYNPGISPDDLVPQGEGDRKDRFVDDAANRFYLGVNPAGGPLDTPVTPFPSDDDNRSNVRNRVESVAFLEPGTYLVICNFLPHFNRGMIALCRGRGRGRR